MNELLAAIFFFPFVLMLCGRPLPHGRQLGNAMSAERLVALLTSLACRAIVIMIAGS